MTFLLKSKFESEFLKIIFSKSNKFYDLSEYIEYEWQGGSIWRRNSTTSNIFHLSPLGKSSEITSSTIFSSRPLRGTIEQNCLQNLIVDNTICIYLYIRLLLDKHDLSISRHFQYNPRLTFRGLDPSENAHKIKLKPTWPRSVSPFLTMRSRYPPPVARTETSSRPPRFQYSLTWS